MYTSQKEKTAGFTLFELVLVIAVIGVMASIVVISFSGFRTGQTIPTAVDEITSLLQKAESDTLSGLGGNQYGVHLQSDRAVLFSGTTYSSTSTSNIAIINDSNIAIASTTLQGGGSEVLFNKLTGETADYGTFIVKNTSTAVGQKTITISKTGLVSSN